MKTAASKSEAHLAPPSALPRMQTNQSVSARPNRAALHATGDATGIYGWVVSDRGALQQLKPMVAASRVKRSLYLLKTSDVSLLSQ